MLLLLSDSTQNTSHVSQEMHQNHTQRLTLNAPYTTHIALKNKPCTPRMHHAFTTTIKKTTPLTTLRAIDRIYLTTVHIIRFLRLVSDNRLPIFSTVIHRT